jgi:hypothetical protein
METSLFNYSVTIFEKRNGEHHRSLRSPGGFGFACFSAGSRLRDPLHRPRRYAELRGDLMKSRPPRSRQSLTDSLFHLGGCAGAAEGLENPVLRHLVGDSK